MPSKRKSEGSSSAVAAKKTKKRAARVPDSVLKNSVKAGATREDCPVEDLCILRMPYGDAAWGAVFREWIGNGLMNWTQILVCLQFSLLRQTLSTQQ